MEEVESFMRLMATSIRTTMKKLSQKESDIPSDPAIASIVRNLRIVDKTVIRPNAGGCAIIAHQAYIAYKKANPRRKATIIYMLHKDRDEENIEQLNNGNAASCAHAIIKLGTKYYDSDTVWNSIAELREKHPYYVFIKVDPKLCKKTIKQAKWNPTFNRETEVPKINKIFGNNIRYSA